MAPHQPTRQNTHCYFVRNHMHPYRVSPPPVVLSPGTCAAVNLGLSSFLRKRARAETSVREYRCTSSRNWRQAFTSERRVSSICGQEGGVQCVEKEPLHAKL